MSETDKKWPAKDDKGNPICAKCGVPSYMHAWVTQPRGPWHSYTESKAAE